MRPLDELLRWKGEPSTARRIAELLKTLCTTRLRKPADLIRLHEAALYFRAYPPSPRVLRGADALLQDFASRLARIDHAPFEDPEVSGIAGTTVSTNFSYDFARPLVDRYGHALRVDWENYQHPERLGAVLARLVPSAAEDWTVEPHIDWREWWESLR